MINIDLVKSDKSTHFSLNIKSRDYQSPTGFGVFNEDERQELIKKILCEALSYATRDTISDALEIYGYEL